MNDPRRTLDQEKMSRLQIGVVAITTLLNAIDGLDVLSISFAAPGIAREWGTSQAALGVVMSMELIGMAIGSFLLGGVADRIGRRRTLLGCLLAMTIGMFFVPTASNTVELSIWRVVVGLGIGGILACVNAVVAEFTNVKRRGLCISIMVIGYPLGGIFGGMLAAKLLETHDWRAIFYLGAILTAVCIPLVFFFVPESIHWLCQKQPRGALKKINKALARMNFPSVDELPAQNLAGQRQSIAGIFSPALLATTLVLVIAYFMHITTFYFILKWSPKIVADMGFSPAMAGGVLVAANIGGALGGAIFGWLTTRIALKKLTVAIMFLTTLSVALFGQASADLDKIKMLAAFAGFFGNAGISGLYSILAIAFPTEVRATGSGFVIGVGRAGAVISPILAGVLLHAGAGLPVVAAAMGLGSLFAGLVLMFFTIRNA